MNAPQSYQDVLNIQDLRKQFRVHDDEVVALTDLNLTIRRGEFVCIVGGSGCGKSTLLRIIAGLDLEYDGVVLFDGRTIAGPGRDRGIVFQEHRLFPWLSVRDNIGFGLAELSRTERLGLVKEHIDLVGLRGFEEAYPHQLSGGMAQRCAIARALVSRPEVLLLDEPFGALDALTKIRMQQEVLRIWEAQKTTMILVTHDIDEAVFLGDRVIVMSSRPGTIKKTISVDLPRPRDRSSYEFVSIRKLVYSEFFATEQAPEAYSI